MSHATIEDVEAGFRTLTDDEKLKCPSMIEEAYFICKSYNAKARDDALNIVVCRMVRRAIESSTASVPMGSSQGSMSALGYSQSWTYSGGSTGELYISKQEKKMLGNVCMAGFISPFKGVES